MRARIGPMLRPGRPTVPVPSTRKEPESGWSKPRIRRNMVVLPPPLPPRITSVSPVGTSIVKSLRTGRPSNFTHTSVNLITGASAEKDEHLGHEQGGHENQDGGSGD